MHAQLQSNSRMLNKHWQSGKKSATQELPYNNFIESWFNGRAIVCSATLGGENYQFPPGLILPGLTSPAYFPITDIPGISIPYKDGSYMFRHKEYTRMLTTLRTDKIYKDTGTHLVLSYFAGDDSDASKDFTAIQSETITTTGETIHLSAVKMNSIIPVYELFLYEMSASFFASYADDIRAICGERIKQSVTIPRGAKALAGTNYSYGSETAYSMLDKVAYLNGNTVYRYGETGARSFTTPIKPLILKNTEATEKSFTNAGLPPLTVVQYNGNYGGKYYIAGWRLKELQFIKNLSINEVYT